MAAAIGSAAFGFGREQAREFSLDPIAYFIQVARKVGVVSLIVGAVMGVLAYYLKASATAAANNEIAVMGNIGTIFSNIKAPTFNPAPGGTAPLSWSLQGVQNFFGDAWSDVQAAGADVAQIGAAMGTLAEDVADGLIDLAKAFLAFVMHFPDILWNGLVWGIGGSVADVLNWAFPWMILLGAGLIIASLVAQGARALWRPVGQGFGEAYGTWSDRVRGRVRAKFDRILRNERPGPAPKTALEAPNVVRAASAPQGEGGNAHEKPPLIVHVVAPVPPAPPPEAPPAVPPTPPPVPEVIVQVPPGQLTKAELEAALGEAFQEAKDQRASRVVMPGPEAGGSAGRSRSKRERSVREILAEPLASAPA